MRFEFAAPTQIVFGAGTATEAGTRAQAWGRRCFVVTGQSPARAAGLSATLSAAGLASAFFPTQGEPSVTTIEAGLAAARAFEADLVIGFGGGSALDAAKAIAGLLTNSGPIHDYLEVVGRGKPLTAPSLPWIAIPTTAGTGAEVTRNAVLSVPAERIKVSLRSPHLAARLAIVDPELSLSAPPDITATTGLDALTQLIEAYVCSRATPLTDSLCAAALPLAATALPRAWAEPGDLGARGDLAFASLSSGLALANAGLGAVHGFAAPIGGLFSAPHGAICAALLAPVMSANLQALAARAPNASAIEKFDRVARWLTGRTDAVAADGIAWVRHLVTTLRIPKLGRWGVSPAQKNDIVSRAQRASSMKANPILLTADELSRALDEGI
jgi:alcohol dehydrogenase class IV